MAIQSFKRDADRIAFVIEKGGDAISAGAVRYDLKVATVGHDLIIDDELKVFN